MTPTDRRPTPDAADRLLGDFFRHEMRSLPDMLPVPAAMIRQSRTLVFGAVPKAWLSLAASVLLLTGGAMALGGRTSDVSRGRSGAGIGGDAASLKNPLAKPAAEPSKKELPKH